MLVDPLKSVNRAVNVTRLNNRTDKIINILMKLFEM